MIGVTVFGLIFTPVFYVIVRRFSTSPIDNANTGEESPASARREETD
jgi:hypothetical protein